MNDELEKLKNNLANIYRHKTNEQDLTITGTFKAGFDAAHDLIKKDYDEKVQKLVEALRFYADKDNWDTNHYCPTIWSDGDIDLGKVASQALTEFEK